MSPFKQKVIEIVQLVPPGTIVSYGQVAAYAGLPRAAREVGWIMNEIGEEVPWWRVVNSKGYISIRGNMTSDKERQKKLLEAEQILVSDGYEIEIEKYRYHMPLEQLKKMQLSDEYLDTLMQRYPISKQLAI